MDSPNDIRSKLPPFLRRVFSALSLDWLPLVFDLYRVVRRTLGQDAHEGLYEMLEYEAELTLVDVKGETAILKKRQKVRFLQDNVIAFQDHAWGNGNILADYHCSPGIEVDRYQDGDRWNILISLRETQSSGDIENFHIERQLRHSFTKTEEWWQTEMQNTTRWLKLAIVFPKDRHCQRALLCEKTRNRTMLLSSECFSDLPDGRQVLTWENKDPKRFETYTLKWSW